MKWASTTLEVAVVVVVVFVVFFAALRLQAVVEEGLLLRGHGRAAELVGGLEAAHLRVGRRPCRRALQAVVDAVAEVDGEPCRRHAVWVSGRVRPVGRLSVEEPPGRVGPRGATCGGTPWPWTHQVFL